LFIFTDQFSPLFLHHFFSLRGGTLFLRDPLSDQHPPLVPLLRLIEEAAFGAVTAFHAVYGYFSTVGPFFFCPHSFGGTTGAQFCQISVFSVPLFFDSFSSSDAPLQSVLCDVLGLPCRPVFNTPDVVRLPRFHFLVPYVFFADDGSPLAPPKHFSRFAYSVARIAPHTFSSFPRPHPPSVF